MPPVSGPLGPRRRIAAVLKRWRVQSGQSLTDVADVTLISTSKLSRLENAEGKPRLRDVRDLIRHFGKQDTPDAAKLERWVEAAEVTGWWTDYDERVLQSRNGFDAHLAYETEATVARVYTLPLVPALLATDAYAEAVYRNMDHQPEDQIGPLMEIRRTRKEALKVRAGRDALKLIAVTHECALRQVVGSPQILRDQLDELVVRSHEDNVSLYVFPFSAKLTPTMTCMYAIFEYKDDLDQDLIQIETQAGFWTIDTPAKVADYKKAHENLIAFSLSEDESRARIRAIRDSIPPSPLYKGHSGILGSRHRTWQTI